MTKRQTFTTTAASALALFTLLAGQAPVALAADNPFATPTAPERISVAAAEGQMKCGGGMGMGMGPGKQGCRMMQMDSNGDGKVSKEEFMQGHEAMFQKIDANGDGMLDEAEMRAHKATMMKEGGMGKCGGQQKDAE